MPPPLDAVSPAPVVAPDVRIQERGTGRKILLALLVLVLLIVGGILALGGGQFGSGVDKVKQIGRQWADQFEVKMARMKGEGAKPAASPVAAPAPEVPRQAPATSLARPIQEARAVKAQVRTNVREGEDAAVAMGRPATVPPPAPNPVAAPAPAAAVAQVPPETVVEKPKPASSPARNVANPAAAAIPEKPFVWPVIKITAVIGAQQGKSLARINGRLVSQGDRIESLTVEAIAPQCVTLVAGTGERRDFYVGANR